MSSSADRSPFDSVAQASHVPSGMQARITVQEINTAEPGPYYVYNPGLDGEGLKEMLHSPQFATLPAGEIIRIGAIEESMLAGRLDAAVPHKQITIMHPIEQKVMDRLHVIAIPASITLQAMLSDRNLTKHVLTHIAAFDKLSEIEFQSLNNMIRPLVRYQDGSLGPIKELTKPAEFRKDIDTFGMLALRLRWLQETAEQLESGRMLEDYRRIIDAKPYLKQLWHKAITEVLIPANDQFRIVAETGLAAVEDRMRNPQNSDNYDRYSFKLMWLLGRQPERTVLTRTLDSAGRGGLSPEEVKIFVANEIARQSGVAAQATAVAQVEVAASKYQCEECGEMLNSVRGGPPRKCRFCGFEFRPLDQQPQAQVETPVVSPGVAAATELDAVAPVVEEAQEVVENLPEELEGSPVEAAPAGEGLTAEDEAEINDLASNLLKGL